MAAKAQDRRALLVLLALGLLALVSVACFMVLGARGSWSFVLQFRGKKLLGLVLVAYSVAVSTVLFQTVTTNRILTPALMGFDALYMLLRTGTVFWFGTGALILIDPQIRFVGEVLLMTGFSALLFRWLFLGEERSLHFLVLVGIIFGVFFRSLSNLMGRMLDPNAYQVLQDSYFASFSVLEPALLWIALAIVIGVTLVLVRMGHMFDVLALGRAQAINLGVDYRRSVMVILMMVAILVAVSTALVGPITFFGLLVASLAHGLIGSSRHRYILPAAVLLAVVALVGGQTLLERVFDFNTALAIIVEFLGGLVFIFLVIRGAAR